MEAKWAECWSYNLESRKKDYQKLAHGEKIEEELYRVLEALINDFLDEWVWFSESPLEDIIIEQQKYARMGFTAHHANIKSEKIRKMAKLDTGRENSYGFSTLSNDCAWIKTVRVACWAVS